jgi:hypothetical protein
MRGLGQRRHDPRYGTERWERGDPQGNAAKYAQIIKRSKSIKNVILERFKKLL